MNVLAATAASAVLLLVPAGASARPADFRSPATAPAPVVDAAPSNDGFDRGVGAGAIGGVVLIAAGGFAAAYRVRTRLAR